MLNFLLFSQMMQIIYRPEMILLQYFLSYFRKQQNKQMMVKNYSFGKFERGLMDILE